MDENRIPRARLREGVVECPICARQIAHPAEHLLAYGATEPTVEDADAIRCPACTGVTFVSGE